MKFYQYLSSALMTVLLLASEPVFAGQISGTIRSENGPLSGVSVFIDCSGVTGSGSTDPNGRFSIYVAATGACKIKVNNASAQVFSSNQPTHHNFVLSGTSLQRR